MAPLSRALPFAVVLAMAAAGCGKKRSPAPPPEVGMWYWHTPFKLTDADRTDLKAIGAGTLYVRAGTLATDGQKIKTILPQRWESKYADVVLTFNFHPGLVSHLEEMTPEALANGAADCIAAATKKAADNGIAAKGVQLDIDCPTRLLPRYAQILRQVRARLPKGQTLSITALPTWLTSKNFAEVADAVDYVVPQFYEGRTGRTVDRVEPITDPEGLKKGLERLEKLGRPCYVGLATYGHALEYDEAGRLVSIYHGLSAEDALRHPALEPVRSTAMDANGRPSDDPAKTVGEDLLLLRAVANDPQGRGKGHMLAYVLPTPAMVRRQLTAFAKDRPQSAKGYILYRFPEPGESMALPLASIRDALANKPPKIEVVPGFKVKTEPWALIDGGSDAERPPRQVTLTLDAIGNTPSQADRQAVEIFVTLDRPGLEGVATGDFDEAQPGLWAEKDRFLPCAPARAEVVRFRRYHLIPGDRLRSGILLIPADGATHAKVKWTAKGPGGFTVFRGESDSLSLTAAHP